MELLLQKRLVPLFSFYYPDQKIVVAAHLDL
jgi:hypothetical protein